MDIAQIRHWLNLSGAGALVKARARKIAEAFSLKLSQHPTRLAP